MKISTVLGSALGVLLLFSVISYAQAYIQTQDPKPAAKQGLVLEVAGQIPETEETSIAAAKPPEKAFTPTPAVAQGDTYSATAYSLRGRTASGQYVSRGLIAADPRVLPLGTRVRLDAGVLVVTAQDPQWRREVERSLGVIRSRLEALLGPDVIQRVEIICHV